MALSPDLNLTEGSSSQQDAESSYRLQCVRAWFPDLLSQTYFLPPLPPNRAHAGPWTGALPARLEAQPRRQRLWQRMKNALKLKSSAHRSRQHVVHDTDTYENEVLQRILHCLRELADVSDPKEVMVIVTRPQLEMNLQKPTTATTARVLTRETFNPQLCDALIVHRQHGLITLHVKVVEGGPGRGQKTNAMVVQKVKEMVDKANKAEVVVRQLLEEVGINMYVIKALVMPGVTTSELLQATETNSSISQDLCHTLGVQTVSEAVSLCMRSDHQPSRHTPHYETTMNFEIFRGWWRRVVESSGHHLPMSMATYEQLVARICGSAATVEVFCISAPRLKIATPAGGADTRGSFARLVLFPEQLQLLNAPPPGLFISGPPGTGKTLVLLVQAVAWLRCGHTVHVVSTWFAGRAAANLIEHQLLQTAGKSLNIASPSFSVFRHHYDLQRDKLIKKAVRQLKRATRGEQLCIIADEAGPRNSENFKRFCDKLTRRVPLVYLWAAAVQCDFRPSCLEEVALKQPFRSPPEVEQLVSKAKEIQFGHVPGYTPTGLPAESEGPRVRLIPHTNGQSGHTEDRPQDCFQCGVEVATILRDLRVGEGDTSERSSLQYRDVLVLCDVHPLGNRESGTQTSKYTGLVQGLIERNIPVLVTDGHDDDAIRDLALQVNNKVAVTNWNNALGLERKVVVVAWIQASKLNSLYEVSRCSSQLVLIKARHGSGAEIGEQLGSTNLNTEFSYSELMPMPVSIPKFDQHERTPEASRNHSMYISVDSEASRDHPSMNILVPHLLLESDENYVNSGIRDQSSCNVREAKFRDYGEGAGELSYYFPTAVMAPSVVESYTSLDITSLKSSNDYRRWEEAPESIEMGLPVGGRGGVSIGWRLGDDDGCEIRLGERETTFDRNAPAFSGAGAYSRTRPQFGGATETHHDEIGANDFICDNRYASSYDANERCLKDLETPARNLSYSRTTTMDRPVLEPQMGYGDTSLQIGESSGNDHTERHLEWKADAGPYSLHPYLSLPFDGVSEVPLDWPLGDVDGCGMDFGDWDSTSRFNLLTVMASETSSHQSGQLAGARESHQDDHHPLIERTEEYGTQKPDVMEIRAEEPEIMEIKNVKPEVLVLSDEDLENMEIGTKCAFDDENTFVKSIEHQGPMFPHSTVNMEIQGSGASFKETINELFEAGVQDRMDNGQSAEFYETIAEKIPDQMNTKQLPLPLFCEKWQTSKEFSCQGGELQGSNSDVVLHVPEHAIKAPAVVNVHCAITTDLRRVHETLRLGATETIVSPVPEYTLDEKNVFDDHLWVVLPHYLTSTSSPDNIRVYHFHKGDDDHLVVEKMEMLAADDSDAKEKYRRHESFFVVDKQSVRILVTHFSGFVCTECNRDLKPSRLSLSAYGILKQSVRRFVNISLFVWDMRLIIKDFENDVLEGAREKEMTKITTGQLDAAPNDTGIALRVEIELDDSVKDSWEHKCNGGNQVFPTVKKKNLDTIFVRKECMTQGSLTDSQHQDAAQCCFYERKPVRFDWKLEEITGDRTRCIFESVILVGYTRDLDKTMTFLDSPERQILSVELYEVKKTSSSQTEINIFERKHEDLLGEPSYREHQRSNVQKDAVSDETRKTPASPSFNIHIKYAYGPTTFGMTSPELKPSEDEITYCDEREMSQQGRNTMGKHAFLAIKGKTTQEDEETTLKKRYSLSHDKQRASEKCSLDMGLPSSSIFTLPTREASTECSPGSTGNEMYACSRSALTSSCPASCNLSSGDDLTQGAVGGYFQSEHSYAHSQNRTSGQRSGTLYQNKTTRDQSRECTDDTSGSIVSVPLNGEREMSNGHCILANGIVSPKKNPNERKTLKHPKPSCSKRDASRGKMHQESRHYGPHGGCPSSDTFCPLPVTTSIDHSSYSHETTTVHSVRNDNLGGAYCSSAHAPVESDALITPNTVNLLGADHDQNGRMDNCKIPIPCEEDVKVAGSNSP